MPSVATQSRLEALRAQRRDLEERITQLEAEAESAGRGMRTDAYMRLRQRVRALQGELRLVKQELRGLGLEPALPSRTQAELVTR